MNNINYTIKKLEDYSKKISDSSNLDQSFKDLIGIKLFDFIQENNILKEEFFNRFEYFERLADNDEYTKCEDGIFTIIQKFRGLITDKDISEISKYIKKERMDKNDDFRNKLNQDEYKKGFPLQYKITFSKLCKDIKDRNNYFTLKNKPNNADYIKNQYEFIEECFLKLIYRYFYELKNDEICRQIVEFNKEYNDFYFKFFNLIHEKPISLNKKVFDSFFFLCAEIKPIRNHEYWYKGCSNLNGFNLKRIKEICNTVINELKDFIENPNNISLMSNGSEIKINSGLKNVQETTHKNSTDYIFTIDKKFNIEVTINEKSKKFEKVNYCRNNGKPVLMEKNLKEIFLMFINGNKKSIDGKACFCIEKEKTSKIKNFSSKISCLRKLFEDINERELFKYNSSENRFELHNICQEKP